MHKKGKGIKKIAKIALIVTLVVLAIPAISLLFLQNKQVQTRLGKYLMERVSEDLHATLSVGEINISFFKRAQLKDILILDKYADTLIYVEEAKVRVRKYRPETKGVRFGRVSLDNAQVNLSIDSSNTVNMSYITRELSRPHVPQERKPDIRFSSIELTNGRFTLSRVEKPAKLKEVDFNDFQLEDLEISLKDFRISGDTASMNISKLSGTEESGFNFDRLECLFEVSKRHMHFNDLEVLAGMSELDIPRLWFSYGGFDSFKQFSTKVNLQFDGNESKIRMVDLAAFTGINRSFVDEIGIVGRVSGSLSNLKGDELTITFDRQSSLAFDFTAIGLPDFGSTFLDLSIRKMESEVLALNSLLNQEEDPGADLNPWSNLGALLFTGHLTGYPDQFVANGQLSTEIGMMVLDLSLAPDSLSGIGFEGRLKCNDFLLGTFLSQEKYLERLDMDVITSGRLQEGRIRASLEGSIDTLEFNNYAYSNIDLKGNFSNTTFEGGVSISDPNIKLDFQGGLDFSGDVPEYRFVADVARARPHFLNFPESDPNYFASFLVETDLIGGSVDDLNGEIVLVNSLFEKTDSYVQIYDVTLRMRNNPEASLMQLRSDLIDFDLTGQYKLSELSWVMKNLGERHMNFTPGVEYEIDSSNYFIFSANLKHPKPILDFFLPSLSLADQSQVNGTYDPLNDEIEIHGEFPEARVAGNAWHGAELKAVSGEMGMIAELESDSLTFGADYSLLEQKAVLKAFQNQASLDINWGEINRPEYSGGLSFKGAFQPDSVPARGFKIDVNRGTLNIDSKPWEVFPSSLLIRRAYVEIDSFRMTSEHKGILSDGFISNAEGNDFRLEIRSLEIGNLGTLAGINANLGGVVSGEVHYGQMEGEDVIFTNLGIDSLSFNEQYIGTTSLDARWNNRRKTIMMSLLAEDNDRKTIEASGDYSPSSKLLDFNINMEEFKLASLNQYVEGVFHNMEGTAGVRLTLDGTISEPILNGELDFRQGSVTMSFLNTNYSLDDGIRIYRNNFLLEDFTIGDGLGNSALINGAITSSFLRDFRLNLNIDARGLQCLNTGPLDNEDFYGTLFGTGTVGIKGAPGNLELMINAITDNNSALFLPLYKASEVQQTDFLTFVQAEVLNDRLVSGPDKRLGGIEMDLNLDVTNDAVVQLIFDPKVGDIIETSGNGKVRILLNPKDGFRMFGDVELESGEYLFTLQNVINKRFKIEPGGNISFNGSPTNASVDLDAIYTTRAAPYNLYPDKDETRESLKKRIPVECQLNLQGDLLSPTLAPGIVMPTADAETRNLLENSTSTEEELLNQFLSLLVINNFYSVGGYGAESMGPINSNIAGVTASELLSNQLSNWLSQISDDFDIGVNYRPGDAITSDEVEVALSTQLLDDRVIISGNVDVGGQETNPTSGSSDNPYIMGDFDVEFKVTDNVSIIAFNRARDELLFETAPYKQGVGISYREEFNDLDHLFARIRERRAKRKAKRKNKELSAVEE